MCNEEVCNTDYNVANERPGNNPNLIIIDENFSRELSRFENFLIDEFQNYIANNCYIILTCFYMPNIELRKLAQKGRFSTTYLTFRCEMRIFEKKIQVSCDGSDLKDLPLFVK